MESIPYSQPTTPTFRLKVCGLTQYEQVMELDNLGVVFAGFIFYAPSPRYYKRYLETSAVKKNSR